MRYTGYGFISDNDKCWGDHKKKAPKKQKGPKINNSDYGKTKLKEYCNALGLTSVITEEAIDIVATIFWQQRILEKSTMQSYAAVFIFIACRQSRFTITMTHIVDTINAIEPKKLSLLNVFNAIWFIEYDLKYDWYPCGGGLTPHGFCLTPVASDSVNAFLIDGEKKEFMLSFTTCESLRCCCNRAGDLTIDNTYSSTSPSFMDLRERLPYIEPIKPEEFEYDDAQPDAAYYAFLLNKEWEEPGIDEPEPPGTPPPMYPARWEINEETADEWAKCDRRRFLPPDHMTEYIDNYMQGHFGKDLVRDCIHWY